jgi:isopenicillin-N N-acyltransferase-like protein
MDLSRREFTGGLGALGLLTALEPTAAAKAPPLPFPELSAAGSPGAIGLVHGRTFAAQIGDNVGFYVKWLARATGQSPKQLLRTARRFRAVLGRHHPAILEEIQGIAKGARRSLDEILLVNARTDMLVMAAQKKAKKSKHATANPGCTALALLGRGRGGRLVALGQNWDWRKDLEKHTLVLRVKPRRGPRVVTFTEAGMVGKIGFNEHRLGVCLNFLSHKSDDPEGEVGVPVHCLLRLVMGCRSLEEAYKLVAWAPRCASANFLMAQHRKGKKPEVLDLEITPGAVGRLRIPERGSHLVHTNHYKSLALAPGCASGRGRSTMNRNKVAEKLAAKLSRSIPDPAARMRKILASREGEPYSVSKTGAPDSPSVTLAGVVMDLSRNRLHLAAGPPHKKPWVTRPGV